MRSNDYATTGSVLKGPRNVEALTGTEPALSPLYEKAFAEMLAPFHFPFWLTAKRLEEALDNIGPSHRRRLDDFLGEYLTFGGYPAVALKKNPQIRQRDL